VGGIQKRNSAANGLVLGERRLVSGISRDIWRRSRNSTLQQTFKEGERVSSDRQEKDRGEPIFEKRSTPSIILKSSRKSNGTYCEEGGHHQRLKGAE